MTRPPREIKLAGPVVQSGESDTPQKFRVAGERRAILLHLVEDVVIDEVLVGSIRNIGMR
jgi:hypothetical protein